MAENERRIMVYLDGSEESFIAAEYAVYLAKTLQAALFGIYVINSKALDDLLNSKLFVAGEKEEYKSDLERDAEKYLNEFKNLAAEKGIEATLIKEEGSVHQKVKQAVRLHEITILAIGELTGLRSRRDEFYDEAERIMRFATCNVLIVKDSARVDKLFNTL